MFLLLAPGSPALWSLIAWVLSTGSPGACSPPASPTPWGSAQKLRRPSAPSLLSFSDDSEHDLTSASHPVTGDAEARWSIPSGDVESIYADQSTNAGGPFTDYRLIAWAFGGAVVMTYLAGARAGVFPWFW